MSDYDKFTIRFGDIEHEMNRENTSLFSFLGSAGVNLAMYDHIFTGVEVEGQLRGMYIFNDAEGFADVSAHLIDNQYPATLNQPVVPQADIDVFDKMLRNQVELATKDGVPEDWQ